MAQQEGEKIFDRAPHVSLVVRLRQLQPACREMLVQLEAGNRRVTGLSLDTDETFDTPFTRRDNPHRAYITIIEGCDKSCAYCVVPFTRGPERSRTSESVMREARRLADMGYTEIQLLGQNVNSYRDPSPAGWDFAHPAARSRRSRRASAACASPPRIRATSSRTSSTPWTRTRSFAITCICRCSPARPRVLRRMHRLYTRDEYMRRIDWMKNAQRHIAITTDIIVGFPGETEEDFQETLDLLDEVQYDSLFSFKYSQRPNTAALAAGGPYPGRREDAPPDDPAGKAARHPDPPQRRTSRRRCRKCMVEGRNQATGQWIGRTSQNRTLNFTSRRETDGVARRASICRCG